VSGCGGQGSAGPSKPRNTPGRLVVFGTMPLGGVLGGVVGRTLGLRAPFLFAGVVLTAVVLLALPTVNNRTVQAARVAAGVAPAAGQA
jgi:hypothetical protein